MFGGLNIGLMTLDELEEYKFDLQSELKEVNESIRAQRYEAE